MITRYRSIKTLIIHHMEDHRVDLVCPKRHGPQEQSDWDSRRGRIQTSAA